MIRASVGRGGEHKVYINADRRAKYKVVGEVVVAVRSADVENIGFLVTEAKPF
jgi:biopolymer transport protein ExbD